MLAVPILAMALVTRLGFRFIMDEGLFHIRVIEQFAAAWPVLPIQDYPSATTPLPYVLWTVLGQVVGYEVWKLRLLTAVVSIAAVQLFYGLCRRQGLRYPLLASGLLLFFPYVFFYGLTLYTTSFGLLFGVAALHFYLDERDDWPRLLAGGLLAALAIFSRQYYLVLPVGMLLYEAVRFVQGGIRWPSGRTLARWGLLALPVLLVAPLFWLWGGLTAPMHQEDHFVHPVLQHLSFAPIFVGFYFLPLLIEPALWRALRQRWLALLAALAVLGGISLAFPLFYTEEPNVVGAAAGLLVHALDMARGRLGPTLAGIGQWGLWLAGVLVLVGGPTLQPVASSRGKLAALLVAFMALMTATPYVFERYYLIALPLLILSLYGRAQRRWALAAWLSVQAVVAVGFSYWQIVEKVFPGA